MLPRVVVHNVVSVDGKVDWFTPDAGLYYEVASNWEVDCILSGSETILEGFKDVEGQANGLPSDSEREESQRASHGPLLVVTDSRGRIRQWGLIREQPYWRDALALVSAATPEEYLAYLREEGMEYILTGDDRVDLTAGLEELHSCHGVESVRVDSGGTLNGVLLREGLVDEISLLIDPSLVGGTSPRSMFRAPDLTSPDGVIDLRLTHVEQLRGGVVWLRYDVVG
jgi:2,5-diamino-6-(ribosylamino)-4(3H)-pyrimidinone 5'-phosphate reductase